MYKLNTFILMIGLFFMSVTNATANTIFVKVTNIDPNRTGNILAMLFSKNGFPKRHEKALEIQSQKAESSELIFAFEVSEEAFAIKILHDENEDRKTSKNWTGIIPSEGLGFSNGATLSWRGAPTFKQAVLQTNDVDDDIVISIIYP